MKFVLKGDLVFTRTPDQFDVIPEGYLVVENGVIRHAGAGLPAPWQDWPLTDVGHQMIMPGFVDLHLHAPQYPNLGLGLDMQLLPWLETYTFPEEAKYSDVDYADRVYRALINQLWEEGTTRSVLFASIHLEATQRLADLMIQSGLSGFVGKVNMDRNSPEFYIEETQRSLEDTETFVRGYLDCSSRVKPIITPRFVPSCSSELMAGLGELANRYNVPVQSHLNENPEEIDWVCQLHPESENYCGVYDQFSLFGKQPTVMAHCIYCKGEEAALIRDNSVVAVHCPHSNANLISGIMPVKEYLADGIRVGLGSDIGAGHTLSMPQVMALAIQLSKMRAVAMDDKSTFLSTAEAFYLGTKGGGSFFGQVGSLEPGYLADFLVVDDAPALQGDLSLEERIQRFIYTGNASMIRKRYVEGVLLERPF